MYCVVRFLYTALLMVLLPWIFIRLWVRGLRFGAYRERWLERLGVVPFPPLERVIWVHAVSVGEALAAIPLIRRLKQEYPNPILVTTMTPTGSERIQAAFKDQLGHQIYHCYCPYDYPFALRRFFSRIKPALGILMETELWPNLLHACETRQIPMMIANARLSPRSLRRYGWLGGLMRRLFQPIQAVAVQSHLDAERFIQLGYPFEHIWETGNIKFDLQLPPYLQEAGLELRNELGRDRLIWIAASTHDSEENVVLDVFTQLKRDFPALLLMLVPRHPDRFHKVAHLCQEKGLTVIRRSQKLPCTSETDVFLGDTMGEMPLFYAASDIAFVGGSFVPVGGHNLLEPAALGLPVLTGPHLFNFVYISALLVEANGATIVNTQAELVAQLRHLLQSAPARAAQGQNAKQVVEQNKGALDKLMALIAQQIQGKAVPTRAH